MREEYYWWHCGGGGDSKPIWDMCVIFMLKCNLINVQFQQRPLPLFNSSVLSVLNTVFNIEQYKNHSKGEMMALKVLWKTHINKSELH